VSPFRIIWRKEIRSFLNSPATYILMVIFLLLAGTYVGGTLFVENVASLRGFFDAVAVLMLFLSAALTMRLLSEERRLGTYEVIGTMPVGPRDIILGKFSAAWMILVGALVPTFIYPVIVSLLGTLDWGSVIAGYMALVLLAGAATSIGVFSSTLSENQNASLIVSSLILFILFILDKLLPYLSLGLLSTAQYLSLGYHYSNIARGVLDSRDIVYFLSLMVFFFLLAVVGLSREYGEYLWSWLTKTKPARLMRAGLVVGVLLFVNLLSLGYFVRVDLTSEGLYALPEATNRMMQSLDDDFLVRVFVTPDLPPPYHDYRRRVQELLEEYRAASHGKLQYQFIDTPIGSELEEEALAAGLSPIAVRELKNDRFQTLKAYAGIVMSYGAKQEVVPAATSYLRMKYDITRALHRLRSTKISTVAFLTGHGEPGLESMARFVDALTKSYTVKTIVSSDSTSIPSGVAALLIVGSHRPFSDAEKYALDQYVAQGGKIAWFVDAIIPDLRLQKATVATLGLEDLFDTYGWTINNDIVVDTRCFFPGEIDRSTPMPPGIIGSNPFMPVIVNCIPLFANVQPVVLSYPSSIDIRLAQIRGVNGMVIATTSKQSLRLNGGDESIDIDVMHLPPMEMFGDADVPIAAVFEGSFKSAYARQHDMRSVSKAQGKTRNLRNASVPTRMAVVGDGSFVLDAQIHGYQNIAFSTAIVNWLIDDETLSSVPTQEESQKTLSEISGTTKETTKYVIVFAPSGLVIVGGAIRLAWRKARRYKRIRSS
jgi:ABC-2 type transport system permease protein